MAADYREIDRVAGGLIDFYAQRGVRSVVLSEYGITAVKRSIALNRVFRARGWITIKDELGRELMDCGASQVFAIADHQVAHIYVNDRSLLADVRAAVERVDGVARVLDAAGQRAEGQVNFYGENILDPKQDVNMLRARIGMVFQKPNPFPKSIYDNVAFGPRVNGKPSKSETDELVETSLKRAALWEEVKDRLKQPAFSLSGGQQQRLCIARALAVDPDVLLMDEPCSALDPIATGRIEDLMHEIKGQYPIVIVTHNMQQAARVSDRTAFFNTEVDADATRPTGVLVEYDATRKIFSTPSDPRTEQYITGRMG